MLTPDLDALQMMLNQAGLIDTTLLTDDVLGQKFAVAYAQAKRELRVFFEPTEMLPNDATEAELSALAASGLKVRLEANYDFVPSAPGSLVVGQINTRQKPLIAVHSVELTYPSPDNAVFTVPNDWLRLDYQAGKLAIVPTGAVSGDTWAAFLAAAPNGGAAGVPFMLRLRYLAGLADLEGDWPDVVELIYRMTVLNVLKLAFLPSSQTVACDGFSRATALSMADWQASVNELKNSLLLSLA